MTARPLTATYRVQFSRDFTFDDARALVPYFRDLGISHLYASPIFQATPGSSHGYDIVDHDAINPELGGEAGFSALVEALHGAGLGVIVDIVPNHAGVGGPTNARWQDVLEFGRRSRSARFFDIDWAAGPLVLPVLDAPLDEMIADGRIELAADPRIGRLQFAIGSQRLPLRPLSVARLVAAAVAQAARPEAEAVAANWLAMEHLRTAAADRKARRAALAGVLADPAVAAALSTVIAEADLSALVGEQHYRPMYWRDGTAAINYRRFFDITDLAGLRVEEPAVFDAVHRLPLALIREGKLDGLRVDHIDGLADPAAYCERLRACVGPDITLHVEKILGPGEALRPWPVNGTTGYETLNLINGLFVDPAGYRHLAEAMTTAGIVGTPQVRTIAAKREVMERSFAAELDGLARLGADLTRRFQHPVRLRTMREIVVALIARLPVYRTYIAETASAEDRRLLAAAADAAKADLSRGEKRALATLVSILEAGTADPDVGAFVRRFQQLSGPAMAKGYEDTELYRAVALASVNEVGSHLTHASVAIDAFHAACADTAARGLSSLTPLSTHDTKRGADTRARLNVLSELAETWTALCDGWRRRHASLRGSTDDGGPTPDRLDEALVYQTLLGAWPVSAERMTGYLEKAMREAKRRTTWTDPDTAYEAGVIAFATALAEGDEGAAFRADLIKLLAEVDPAGRRNGLSQTLLQLTIPGVPDIYRGSEFYEHVLVDPDNRRPVDWPARRAALDEALAADTAAIGDDEDVGTAKQALIAKVLAVRRADPTLFAAGGYEPLPVTGGGEVIAFARVEDGRMAVVVVATRSLAPRRGDVVVDLGNAAPRHWRSVVGPRDVRQDGRLLRIDRAALPALLLARPR